MHVLYFNGVAVTEETTSKTTTSSTVPIVGGGQCVLNFAANIIITVIALSHHSFCHFHSLFTSCHILIHIEVYVSASSKTGT